MAPQLSVVIPTRQRPLILKQCIAHLRAQTMAEDIEVVVVHDGEDCEATLQMLQNEPHIGEGLAHFTFFSIPKAQQGMARNRGMERVHAPFTLFIGDDIFLAKDACDLHCIAHKEISKDAAVLGHTTWDPTIDITPAMRWLESTGWQFGYGMLVPHMNGFVPQYMQHRFTYTSHISVPSSVAHAHPFNTTITLYGWEDILWGWELRKAGIPLFYEPDAEAYHNHRVTLEDSLQRIETVGHSLLHLQRIAPELDRMPMGWKLFAYHVIALLPTLRGKHYRAFLKGLAHPDLPPVS